MSSESDDRSDRGPHFGPHPEKGGFGDHSKTRVLRTSIPKSTLSRGQIGPFGGRRPDRDPKSGGLEVDSDLETPNRSL